MSKINIRRRARRKGKKKNIYKEVALIKKKVLSGEVKYKQKNTQSTCHITNPANILLTDIPQGYNQGERIGNDINVLSVGFNLQLTGYVTAPNYDCRVVLYKCMKPTPGLDELFLGGASTGYNSFRNPDYLKQYQVLYDKKFCFNQYPYFNSQLIALAHTLKSVYMCKQIKKDIKVAFSGPNIGDQAEGGIYLAIFTHRSSSEPLTYEVETKVRYSDN